MKLVIDIPDSYYEYVRDTTEIVSGQRSGKTFMSVVYSAVANGTPLPKGHGRLIDADALENAWHEEFLKGMSISSGMLNTFRDAPTIIDAESEEV